MEDLNRTAWDSHYHDEQNRARRTSLVVPLFVLTALASYVAGLGFRQCWTDRAGEPPVLYLEQVISGALHLGWVLCVAYRGGTFVTAVCWTSSLVACDEGLGSISGTAPSSLLALTIEGIPLLLAMSLTPSSSVAERLARWRRARSEISVQLRMGEGLVHWLPAAFRQFLKGTADMPAGSSYRRFLAEMADAEHTLRIRLNCLAIPEQLRQSILTTANSLVGQAEKSAAILAMEFERQALNAAAVCRDQCEDLENMQPDEKAALAKQCEDLFLELVHPRQPMPG